VRKRKRGGERLRERERKKERVREGERVCVRERKKERDREIERGTEGKIMHSYHVLAY
jgi:hypothetical protein